MAQAQRQKARLSELERNSAVRYQATDACSMIYVAGCGGVDELIEMNYAQLTLAGCGR